MLCLELWRNSNSGPAMNAIHFAYSFGSLTSPALASLFVSCNDDAGEGQCEVIREARMDLLYVIVGLMALSSVPFYVLFTVIECRREARRPTSTTKKYIAVKERNNANVASRTASTIREKVLHWVAKTSASLKEEWRRTDAMTCLVVAIMSVFFFTYVGTEHAFTVYLSAFAQKSALRMSAVGGAYVSAVFSGSFALGRFSGIFVSHWLNPIPMLAGCFALSIASSAALCVAAEFGAAWLYAGSVGVGLGMSMIYASAFVWVERRIQVSGSVAAAFTMAGSMGPDAVPLGVGQLVEHFPMVLMYLVTGVTAGCMALLACAAFCANKREENAARGQNMKKPVERQESDGSTSVGVISSDSETRTTETA